MSLTKRYEQPNLPDSLLKHLISRDAALWLGEGINEDKDLEIIRSLIALPWKIVLCESTSGALASSLERTTESDGAMARQRGFIHVIASDPAEVELPPRALPVYFLNGRADARSKDEGVRLSPRVSMGRRFNMLKQLEEACPSLLLVVSLSDESPLPAALELWEDGFRADLVVSSIFDEDATRLDDWLATGESVSSVIHATNSHKESISVLLDRASATLVADKCVVRVLDEQGSVQDVDISRAELDEHPILDRYEVIQSRDLHHLVPEELTSDDLVDFFTAGTLSWRPYAAGLPWYRDRGAGNKLEKALAAAAATNGDRNRVLLIASESGAGGTTLSRILALEMARQGFPAMVARPTKFQPSPTELATYFHRVRQVLTRAAEDAEEDEETTFRCPWLLVFDVQHWDGRLGEIPFFARHLGRSGQPVVILAVVGSDLGDELTSNPGAKVLERVSHQLSESEVLALGRHLNLYLKPFGKEKSEIAWHAFWEKNRPTGITQRVASFWIALEFWLKGQLDLNESVQEWVARQFKEAEISDPLRCLILEIAALSIERQPYPEKLFPDEEEDEIPYSVTLEQVRADAPALSLLSEHRDFKRWALAHDLIGRYILNAVYFDRILLKKLGLESAEDPVHLRLLMYERFAGRPGLGRKWFFPIAVEFAVNYLKLGTDGNLEVNIYWRKALQILERMPGVVWKTSRTFNHHVAISRRRVATSSSLFELTLDEKAEQLSKAIQHLEYALSLPKREQDEESNLNLYNSLSLACQNLAEVEDNRGASATRIKELRDKATETARKAKLEGAGNPYVLETLARNLLQHGRVNPNESVQSSAEALSYIYQGLSLDNSYLRESRLIQLANQAIDVLRDNKASNELGELCAKGNPLGFLGRAWLVLAEDLDRFDRESLEQLPKAQVEKALAEIEKAPHHASGVLLRFGFDLVTISRPFAFREQLDLLDRLEGTSTGLSLQLQLERAILLYQQNRHDAANEEFRRLRKAIKTQDAFVDVPTRLRWLRTESGEFRIFDARVRESSGYRSFANVPELRTNVPFVAQEFGKRKMPNHQRFKCRINFGPMGPFIKPTESK